MVGLLRGGGEINAKIYGCSKITLFILLAKYGLLDMLFLLRQWFCVFVCFCESFLAACIFRGCFKGALGTTFC